LQAVSLFVARLLTFRQPLLHPSERTFAAAKVFVCRLRDVYKGNPGRNPPWTKSPRTESPRNAQVRQGQKR